MKRALTALSAASTALLLSNCTPGTPQTRIDRNYTLYEALPAKHRTLVGQGQIAKGMSKSAVYLALGNPGRKSEGFRDNARYERWDYTRMRPVYYNSFHTFFGHGWGRRGYSYSGIGFAPTIEYIPYRSSSVLFRRGVVDSWERLGPPYY